MYSVSFTEPAEDDLESCLRYIADVLKAPSAANQLLKDIEEKVKLLETAPLCCALVDDDYLCTKGLRSLLVKNYQIFYIVKESDKSVSIIRILYARRDWAFLLRTDELPKQ
jgi:plasmid stabilization system protein ParE